MESVINNHYIKSYAEIYTDQVILIFFENKTRIRGEEILELTNIRQINLFVIKKLMEQWKKEADKLKSPFFNYEDEAVIAKLQELMNILSKNIWIDKKHFQPLLTEAVTDSLYLIFSPYAFFQRELTGSRTMSQKSEMLARKKFIRINGELYESFLNKIKMSEKDDFSSEETRNLFNKVCEEINFQPEEPDPYIEKFSEIEPLYVQKIYKDIEQDPGEKKANTTARESGYSVMNQYNDSRNSLVQELEKETPNTLLDFHQKQKIESIRKNISIHQKFMFVKELFQKSDEEFNQVINFLDQCDSRNDAMEYLENNYFNPGIWKDEDEAVIEFMIVIDKKFI
ncbi:MAG: hypothetical protein KFF73_17605 [Cyclobacteriaceae bacterium]|nr:hypothetical protein [Cyclobacteriaceae bacterium]